MAEAATLNNDALWTPADLARFLGYAESTVIRMASAEPDRLPPRVAAMHKPRWLPSVAHQWAAQQSGVTAPQERRKPGRPRRRQEVSHG